MVDWRQEQLCDKAYLRGVRHQFKRYRPYRPGWEHDHCVAGFTAFSETGLRPNESTLQEGCATCADDARGDAYAWVCSDWFETFKEPMGCRLAEADFN